MDRWLILSESVYCVVSRRFIVPCKRVVIEPMATVTDGEINQVVRRAHNHFMAMCVYRNRKAIITFRIRALSPSELSCRYRLRSNLLSRNSVILAKHKRNKAQSNCDNETQFSLVWTQLSVRCFFSSDYFTLQFDLSHRLCFWMCCWKALSSSWNILAKKWFLSIERDFRIKLHRSNVIFLWK